MILRIKTSADLPYSEVTPEAVYRSRRDFMKAAAVGVAGAAAGLALPSDGLCARSRMPWRRSQQRRARSSWMSGGPAQHASNRSPSYNNYYEFGTRKDDPARNAGRLTVKPWTVKVDGLVDKPATTASRIWSTSRRSKSASTGSAASKRGRW